VLVFENRSGGEDLENMGEIIADETNTQLSKISGFAVKAHASARRLSLDDMTYGEIADRLGAEYLLHGNWRRGADSMRVSARLIVGETQEQLWAEIYNTEWSATDLFQVSSDIAEQVAATLNVTPALLEAAQLAADPTENTEAYVAYQRGRHFWNRRTEAGLLEAVEQFKEATRLDSNFALAYSGLADAYAMLPFYGPRSLSALEAAPLARAAAHKALALDSLSAEAHTSLGSVRQYFDWDLDAAIVEFERAIALNANYATAHHWYGTLICRLGRLDEGIAELELAWDLDPLSPVIGRMLGSYLIDAGRLDEGVERYLQTLAIDSTLNSAREGLAQAYARMGRLGDALAESERISDERGLIGVYLALGDRNEALEVLQRLLEGESEGRVSAFDIAQTYAVLGHAEEALLWLRLLEGESEGRVSPFQIAKAYAVLGQAEGALLWFRRAVEQRDVRVPRDLWGSDWDALRHDARFVELAQQVRYSGPRR
jgi:TolB-like protein